MAGIVAIGGYRTLWPWCERFRIDFHFLKTTTATANVS